MEARIVQFEAILKNAKVLDNDEMDTDLVNLGSKVKSAMWSLTRLWSIIWLVPLRQIR